jgi:hypothetical protein
MQNILYLEGLECGIGKRDGTISLPANKKRLADRQTLL